MIPSIPALREQTMALATQAAGVNHQTLNDTERTAFHDTIIQVHTTVRTQLQGMGSIYDHDYKELTDLSGTLNSLRFQFGTKQAKLILTSKSHSKGHYAYTAPLVNATATVRDLKIAAANAFTIPFASIKAVAISGEYYNDDVLICSKISFLHAVQIITI